MKILMVLIFTVTVLFNTSVYAKGMHKGEHNKAENEVKAIMTYQDGLDILSKAILVMQKTVLDSNIEEMFAGGAIMDEWHEATFAIADAVEAIDTYVETLEGQKQEDTSLALEDFLEVLDQFHIETHEKNMQGSRDQAMKAHTLLGELKDVLAL
ncbi:MAG: hypothetical protein ACI9TY_000603 [Alphaproteobacteria bacterium]|jgi:hypothetical protein